MSEHTPLPLKAKAYEILDAEGTIIGRTYGYFDGKAPDRAALIVRSVNLLPELVEALQRACVYLPASSADLAATIEALIAKATA